MIGKVKWFNKEKGFGFITTATEGDVFIHVSDAPTKDLQEGDKVDFEVGKGPKGLKAVNVTLLETAVRG